jgi:wyosine [tRNA(Phe)-imidazoG37] synthetase (radical SAM superfamily)
VGIVFGPVPSRRLGRSLGIDVLPPADKMCTLNCVYCQVGRTQVRTIKRGLPLDSALINRAIDEALPREELDVVTFSGTGEPTLHQHLGQFIGRVKGLCETPVAVLTNSTLIDKPDVRRDLALADIVVPSLDAATQGAFERVNRPHPTLLVDRMIEGLVAFRKEFSGKLFLEIMLVKGVNDDMAELVALKAAAERIAPDLIHLNTVTRPPAESDAQPLSPQEMARAAAMLGPKAVPVGAATGAAASEAAADLAETIAELVQRRGVTVEDLIRSLGADRPTVQRVLEQLIEQRRVKKIVHGGVSYYREFY